MLKQVGVVGLLLAVLVILPGCKPPTRNVANATAAGAAGVATVAGLDRTSDPIARKVTVMEIVAGVKGALQPSGTAGDILSVSALRDKIVNDICPKGYESYALQILAAISPQSIHADKLTAADLRSINWLLNGVETAANKWHADDEIPIGR